MKTVIDKKIYNTETATLIAEWDNGMCGSDARACEEALYRTEKGQYFICGSGGALTDYVVYYGSSSSGSTVMWLVSPEEAYDWCEKRDISADIIAANFEIGEG